VACLFSQVHENHLTSVGCMTQARSRTRRPLLSVRRLGLGSNLESVEIKNCKLDFCLSVHHQLPKII